MNIPKEIAAEVRGLDYAKLNVYLKHRREQLRDRLEKSKPDEVSGIQGQIAEVRDLMTLGDAVEKSLSAAN